MNTNIKNLNRYLKYFAGFTSVGIIITIVSLLSTIFLIEIIKISLLIAYPLIYIVSILASYYLNKDLVFKFRGKENRLFLYFTIYLTSMLLGLVLIYMLKKISNIPESIVAILILPLTTIYNFVFVSLLFNNRGKKE